MEVKKKKILLLILVLAMLCAVKQEKGSAAEEPETEAYCYTGLGNRVKRTDEELTARYEKGITMEEEQVEARKKRAEELELLEEVDERYFLGREYYSRFSVSELEQKGLTLLVECMTEQEIAAWERRLGSGIGPRYITRGNSLISWTNSAGITTRTYAFDVDGHVAFCGDHGKTAPPTGTAHSEYKAVTKDAIKKFLYYGYGGPEDEMTKLGYSKAKSYVIMAMSVSNLRHGKELGANGRVFWEHIKDMPVPTEGNAWYVETEGSAIQDLFFYEMPKKGKLQVHKESARVEITSGNENYSLAGAQYGVYTNANGVSGQAAVLDVGEDGWTQPVELDAGTYYLKELKAPPGFVLDSTVYKVIVTAGNTSSHTHKEIPQMNPVSILIQKLDAETGKDSPQGTGTLSGAEFTVKFYGQNTEKADGKPLRTWVFRTDEKGRVLYEESYKVSGDSLYTDASGKEALPLGIVTIQETKAPEGYHRNEKLFTVPVTAEGQEETVSTFQKPVVPENIITFTVIKKQKDTETVIPGVEFEYRGPGGDKKTLKTDSQGRIIIKGLKTGEHSIRESVPAQGYELCEKEVKFTVAENGKILLDKDETANQEEIRLTVTKEGNLQMEAENKVLPFKLRVVKKNEKDQALSGAEFTLYEEKACEKPLKKGITDDSGILLMEALIPGKTYYLKETKAPDGYRLTEDGSGKVPVSEIRVESTPVLDEFVLYVNGEAEMPESPDGMYQIFGEKEDRTVQVTVINKTLARLPDTGSGLMLPVLLAGISFMTKSYTRVWERRKGD